MADNGQITDEHVTSPPAQGRARRVEPAWISWWRSIVLAGVIGIGGVLWTTVRDVQTLLVSSTTTQTAITKLEGTASHVNTELGIVKLAVNKTQTTLESGIQQVLFDQNRRISALEDRNARIFDLLTETQKELVGVRAELSAIRRVSEPSQRQPSR